MAVNSWISGAPAIAQVVTLTVGGTAANAQVYTVKMGYNNTKSVSYTATGSDTNTSIATALYNALAACTFPEFEEITWANPSAGTITATAATAGIPFTLTVTATGTGTLTQSTTTANSGPNDVSIAANWSQNAIPATGQDIYIENSTQGLLYNLQALNGIVVNSITWDSTFTGQAGLPSWNANGYVEYRQLELQLAATTEDFLAGTGGGSQLIRRYNGATAWTVNVNSTGSPQTQGQPALYLRGDSASNVLNVTSGYVGSALIPGNTSNWSGGINIGYQQNQNTDVTLWLGSGCTLGNVTQNGGKVYVNSSVGTYSQRGGTSYIYGSAAITTLDVESGTCDYQSSGTAGTVTIGANGTVDCSSDPRARTFTTTTVYGSLIDPNHTVTHTNPPYFPDGIGKNGASLDWGTNIHLARS